jgi:cell division initiation protein
MVVLTPLEIYNKQFSKSLRGYREDEVDNFIDKVLADYEKLFKENLDLKENLANHHTKLEQYRKIEETLHNSIIVAQQTAEEVKKNAEERAALLNMHAEQRAREIIAEAEEKAKEAIKEYADLKQKTLQFKIKLKSFLQAQLDILSQDIGYNQGDSI